jgi:aspartate aminotransferase
MRNRAKMDPAGVINLASGEVAHEPPGAARAAARLATSLAATHLYGQTGGQTALREAVAALMRERGAPVDAERVLITAGAKQAIFYACIVLLDPGDHALIPIPSWPTYREAVRLVGGIPITVTGDPSRLFKIGPAYLDAVVTPRTKAIFLASPNNPTGAVYNGEELRAIAEWATARDLWVVVDEVYADLLYGSARPSSMLAEAPELADRCVTVDSIAKRWAMPGWRIGWLVGPTEVVAAATRLQSHSSSHPANICQAAALGAIEEGSRTLTSIRRQLTVNRQAVMAALGEIEGIECAAPLGAFYAFADLRGLLERRARERRAAGDIAFVEELFVEAHTALVAGDVFGAPGFARISFGIRSADLVEGLRRLAEHTRR